MTKRLALDNALDLNLVDVLLFFELVLIYQVVQQRKSLDGHRLRILRNRHALLFFCLKVAR